MTGAGNRSRTYDLRITNALLYQLSYSGEGGGVYGFESEPGTSPPTVTMGRDGALGGANFDIRTAYGERCEQPLSLE